MATKKAFTYHGGGVLFVTHPARASGSGSGGNNPPSALRKLNNELGAT